MLLSSLFLFLFAAANKNATKCATGALDGRGFRFYHAVLML